MEEEIVKYLKSKSNGSGPTPSRYKTGVFIIAGGRRHTPW